MTWYKNTKYSTAKSTRFGDKIFDSKFEASVAQELHFRQAAGEIESYECQVKIPLIVNDYLVAEYKIDFVAYRTDGITEYIEAKGGAGDTQAWRLKWKLFEALYSDKPDVELRVIWQGHHNKLRKIKKRV